MCVCFKVTHSDFLVQVTDRYAQIDRQAGDRKKGVSINKTCWHDIAREAPVMCTVEETASSAGKIKATRFKGNT